ncbi:alpha/beta hydrolase [Nocardia puris]|uniref:Pimeloyl-ACP methyl ester carboxylesterase n=1 Tax=Nocardia puris TaxID=208602 RepID=A0A366DDW5_9NOCA|nr:alpha/beta hydrolase [Nocardia puris]MBF6214994.1 alpha/beta hydrolase [Nocardia puris]MBF6367239.1 alpha/beta hydrolase [Nocardia puris]MBF6461784.1 alpha/beta hydrolase [Nocardia puris]RBO88240.1 pimeloyl-ACP methyl ester carboxylesterase [Nocardia puris]
MSVERIPFGQWTFDVDVEGPADGPAVLLLHGFPHSRASWTEVAPILHRAGLRTIAPDQRGYSDDARPTTVSEYALPLLAADALAVLDALGVESAHVVGHDWGAAVAWYLGARHADRVNSLVALAIPHLDAYQYAYRVDAEQQHSSQYVEFLMSDGAAEQFLADDAAQLYGWFAQAGEGVLTPEQVERYVTKHREPGVLDAALNWYRANNLLGEPFEFGPVPVPTTFVWSVTDTAVSKLAVEKTSEHVTGPYRLVTLEQTSHWQPQQDPETVAAEIVRLARTEQLENR